MKKRLATVLNAVLFAAAIPFVCLAVGLLYIAWLIAGNPQRTTFNDWVADTLILGL